ncbi:MAG: alkaline phosphatase family protein [Bryobacteraceae bacterium]
MTRKSTIAGLALPFLLSIAPSSLTAQSVAPVLPGSNIKNVMLISIDGMHALDFANCAQGIPGANGGKPYCPSLAQLQTMGVNYTNASTTKPSDSFPGLLSELTGGTPRSVGVYYDVSYDRSLAPPKVTTPYGVPGGPCPGPVGTIVELDESITYDYTKLNGGGGINPDYLPRDPNTCMPVYPHQYVRVNTIFDVIKSNGGYTAWSDKHFAYDIVNGHPGGGVDDLYTPEVNSYAVPLPSVTGCNPLPDPPPAGNDWTQSFQNIQCYDSLKVNAVLNWINGLTSSGQPKGQVPAIFGMNFQAVSVGQKLVENGVPGGYMDAGGTPTPKLLSEIQFVDTSIGKFVAALKSAGLTNSTLIIITAKHGQSPIDPKRTFRIPADDSTTNPPSVIIQNALGASSVVNADEDDVSMVWLADQTKTVAAVEALEANETEYGAGEIFYGNSLKLLYPDPLIDPRTPDIIVAPNVGVVYTGGKHKISEHGGRAQDDTNVMLLVSNPAFTKPVTYNSPVFTTQIAPTILEALVIGPNSLDSVRAENTQPLPGFDIFSIAIPGGTLPYNFYYHPQ